MFANYARLSKKDVLRFRSVSSIVIAVIPTDQTNKRIRSALVLIGFILMIVYMKCTAPRIEDTPARYIEKCRALHEEKYIQRILKLH